MSSIRRRRQAGGIAFPAFQAAAAFGPLKQKLNGSQNVTIFVVGDSTAYSSSGPYQLFLQQLASTYSGTASLRLWGEWNNGTGLPTGPKSYNAAVNTVYGGGPTITMYLLALPGSVLSFPWDSTRKAAALDGVSTPDVIIIHQGHNFNNFDTQAGVVTSGDNLVTGRGLLLAGIGMLSLQWNNVPQIMTTQNPNHFDNGMSNMLGAYAGAAAAVPTLTLVDTATDFLALRRADRLYRPVAVDAAGVHPSDATGNAIFDGATLQMTRLINAFTLATPGANTTTSWPATAGTNILTNGDFSSWTGSFPDNVTAFNGQTAAKDAGTIYSGSYPYSMQLPTISQFGSVRYTFTAGEKSAMVNQTISLSILFQTTSTYSGGTVPFYAVLIVNNLAQANPGPIQWQQGSTVQPVSGNWYLAVFPGVQIGSSLAANASINLYPNFPQTPTGGSAWVQKMMMVTGNSPKGPF